MDWGFVATTMGGTAVTADSPPRAQLRRDLISEAWNQLAGRRRAVLGLGVLALAAAQAESAALVLIALIADAVASGDTNLQVELGALAVNQPVIVLAVVTLVGVVIAAFLVFTHGRLAARVTARIEREDRDRIVRSYAEADWEYQSGQTSSRAEGRIRLMRSRSKVFSGFVGWFRAAASIAVFVAVAASMSAVTALIIVGFGVVLSIAVLPIRLRTKRIARRTAQAEVGLTKEFVEAIDQGPDVHVFGAWPSVLRRFDARSGSLQVLRERTGKLQSLLPVVYQFGALALILLIMLAASVSQSSGEMGNFAASALLLLRSIQYGQAMQQSLHQLANAVPAVGVLERELKVPPPRMAPGQHTLKSIDRVELVDVVYQYPDAEQAALSGVSLDLRPGVIVGLAGPSGSGKSTLAQILLRLRWPTAGRYLVNGRDAGVYSAESWARLVSHLPQQPRLLHGSLLENVTFYDDSISRASVEASLRSVGLHALVETLPGGLDTKLGPAVRNLSGGQVQRLGIARSLVREPRLVVFDEPTSALDVNAERIVGDALATLRAQPAVTVVVIAHRASTLALCDEIVVLQDGRVAAAGPSEDLARRSDFLAATWGNGLVTKRRSGPG